MSIADEMPDIPQAAPGGAEEPEVGGVFDPALMQQVQKVGEPFPTGTFHLKLVEWNSGWQKPDPKKGDKDPLKGFGDQPYFQTYWECLQAPYEGKRYPLFIGWVTSEVQKMAVAGDAKALSFLKNRLAMSKTVLEGCGTKSIPGNDFKNFLNGGPEALFHLELTSRKVKDEKTGKWVPGEGQTNNLITIKPIFGGGH